MMTPDQPVEWGCAETFPFMNFPQELRNEVYRHAVEPWVLFTHTTYDRVRSEDDSPDSECLKGLRLPQPPIKDCLGSSNEPIPRWLAHNLHQAFLRDPRVLGYKISTYSPLLLLNKEISSEFRDWLRRVAKPGKSTRKMLRRSIQGDWFCHTGGEPAVLQDRDAPIDPDVLRIIGRCSRLEFDLNVASTGRFLNHLPDSVSCRIQSVVLRAGCLLGFENGYMHCSFPRTYTPFGDFLSRRLPYLHEIAVFVPVYGHEAPDLEFVDPDVGTAVRQLADLLANGIIDNLRFLYVHSWPSILLECWWIKMAQRWECQNEECRRRQRRKIHIAGPLQACNRCLKALYCSEECRLEDFSVNHRGRCQPASDRQRANPPDPDCKFKAELEELRDQDTDEPLVQTAAYPYNKWAHAKTVVVLRRFCND